MDKMKEMLKKRGLRRIGGKRGFTLIELLIVMSIIAILVAIVVMSLTGFIGGAEESAAEADQRSLQTAVVAYFATEGVWPTSDGTLPSTGATKDIEWGPATHDIGGTAYPGLVPGFVLQRPASDNTASDGGGTQVCDWAINEYGIVVKGTGATDACAY